MINLTTLNMINWSFYLIDDCMFWQISLGSNVIIGPFLKDQHHRFYHCCNIASTFYLALDQNFHRNKLIIHKGTIMWNSRVSLIQLSQVMNNVCICQPTTFPAISRLQLFFIIWKANSLPNFNHPMISLQHGRTALIGNFMPSQKHSKSQDKKLRSPSILNDFRLMKCICHELWQENTTKAFSSHKKTMIIKQLLEQDLPSGQQELHGARQH